MKHKIYGLLIFFGFSQLSSAQSNKLTNLAANELLDKVIQYYDPSNKWNTFKGELHLYTVLPSGILKSEDIYLDNASGIYQSFLYQNDSILMKRWDENGVTYTLNGVAQLSVVARKILNLQDQDIRFIKRRHHMEIGWPMNLKALGGTLNPVVKKMIFNNKPCLILESIGTAIGTQDQYPLLQQTIFYYVNPDNFSLEGMDFSLGISEQNIGGTRVVFNEDVEINGLKIPRVKTYYNLKNKEYLYTTSAFKFTQNPFIDEMEEQKMINEVLEAETFHFEKRNFEAWAATWSHKADVVHSFAAKGEGTRIEGWRNVKKHIQSYFNQFPDPVITPIIERSNYVYHIYETVAWVYFDSKETSSHGRHQRILRKEKEQWKLISMVGIDEASYDSPNE